MLSEYFRRSRLFVGVGGFTLLEVLVVLFFLGVVSALASPGWLKYLERLKVSDAQSKIYAAIRATQNSAQSDRLNWQFSIRETAAGEVEWARHRQTDTPMVWRNLGTDTIDIDTANTTLDSSNGAYYVRFNYKGYLASRTRTLTLTSSRVPSIKRCVVMSNLLGAMRQAKEQQTPSASGRYCH